MISAEFLSRSASGDEVETQRENMKKHTQFLPVPLPTASFCGYETPVSRSLTLSCQGCLLTS